MFNFTTSTIINKNVDYNNPSEPLILVGTNSNGYKVGEILIKRVGKFTKDNVVNVTKADPKDAKVPETTLALAELTGKKIYRLALYIGLTRSENSYYANDFVYKGKPFYVEAVGDGNATNLAKAFVDNAKKYMTLVYEKPIVKLSSSATNLTVTGTDPHQVIKVAQVEEWVEPDLNAGKIGEWKIAVTGKKSIGEPGFGTYSHLMENYILPTGANLRFNHIIADETPLVNGKYTQYIINMSVNRGVMGGDAVGQTATSKTTHCFWVEAGVVTDFDDAMKAITEQKEFTKADEILTPDSAIERA